MNRFRNTLQATSIALLLIVSGAAQANTNSSKSAVLDEAVALCESAAINRYGDNAVKSISDKVKWSKSLSGATVKMKIKKKAKRAQKYSCVVSLDKTVLFHKA